MSGEINVDAGFYFYVRPQSVAGVVSSRLNELVGAFDDENDDLSERFLQGEDENSHQHPSYASGWFLNSNDKTMAMYGIAGLGDADRWSDFKVCNGDFTQLHAAYDQFVANESVVRMKAFLEERYGADSYEIRLGSFAGQSF